MDFLKTISFIFIFCDSSTKDEPEKLIDDKNNPTQLKKIQTGSDSYTN